MKTRDEVIQAARQKMVNEAVCDQIEKYGLLQIDEVTEADAEFVQQFMQQFDHVWLLWPEPRSASGSQTTVARHTLKEGFLRCQSFPCADRATALKLYEMCRAPDNHAPAFPPEPAAGNA